MNRSLVSTPRYQRLKPLIDLALSEGWQVSYTANGRLTFTKPGLPRIHSGVTSKHHRIRRAQTHASDAEIIANEGDHHG